MRLPSLPIDPIPRDLVPTNRSQSGNALRSTGPTSENGKRRSRQNAIRHGLSAETVVEIVEDIEDYRGFEATIIADYDARIERERLASLLWRLRRATLIETELLRIQAEVLRDHRSSPFRSRNTPPPIPTVQDVQEDQADSDPRPAIHSTSRSSAMGIRKGRDGMNRPGFAGGNLV
jgi:hypothetical protein